MTWLRCYKLITTKKNKDRDMADTHRIVDFGEPEKEKSIIKVIGVGGGGGNAVNHMYREGIHDVSFVLCNTDNQALNDSPVPVHLQLGKEGLGAGNKPAKAREAAEESLEDIKAMLNDGTKMAFITAGMGGGTGTGAAPVPVLSLPAFQRIWASLPSASLPYRSALRANARSTRPSTALKRCRSTSTPCS